MKRSLAVRLFLFFMWVVGLVFAQWSPPEWVTHNYPASTDRVFAAALKSVQVRKHEIMAIHRTTHTVDFHIGTAAWSSGYNMRLTVMPVTGGEVNISRVTVGVSRSGGDALPSDPGKEVQKIFVEMDTELSSPE